ncbi:MFS transporter [Flavobacteriaceae bacterium]|nr:MFS transporter [Flavobacteriaceae bacterium]
MGQKIAFGFGMLANQMFPAVISIFIVVLVQNLGFPGWMWGVVSLVPRLFDAITDPIMGFISDNRIFFMVKNLNFTIIFRIIEKNDYLLI